MLIFILDRTAVPYFSNLVWFIGNKSVVLDDKILTTQRSEIFYFFAILLIVSQFRHSLWTQIHAV